MKISKISLAGALFITFMLFTITLSGKVYANNLILTGDTDGLKISSNDLENPLAMLFSLDKMTPGDNASSTITIKNTYEHAFSLSVEVKDLHDDNDGLNLSDKFIITIEQDGTILTSFPKTNGVYIFPNEFIPQSSSVLKFTVNLPGEVGNEYQNTTAQLQWIFSATRLDPSNPPDPTDPTKPPNPPGPTRPPRTPNPTKKPDSPAPIILPEIPPPPPPTIPKTGVETIIEDDLSNLEQSSSDIKIMPKTGETSLLFNIFSGLVLILIGFILLFKKETAGKLIMAVKNSYKKKEKLK